MDGIDKSPGKIIRFNKPPQPGEPDPFDKVEPRAGVTAITPFVLPDHTAIPPRDWLYDRHYVRGHVSATVAAGGVGKSSLTIAESLAMATGRPLLGTRPRRRLKAWIWNGEDPYVELQRRFAAACLQYGIVQADIDGQLFVDSGRDSCWSMATQSRDGLAVNQPLIDDMVDRIRRDGIDVVVIDPFVASHQVPENDNNAIAAVAQAWGAIAERGQCGVMLVHHVRKTPPGTELTMEDMRGASALLAAVRSGRAINPMPPQLAVKLGIANPGSYMRINTAGEKNNLAPARVGDDWYELVSVDLRNGVPSPGDGGDAIPADQVGVVTKWTPPDMMEGVGIEAARKAQALVGENRFRLNAQSKDWIGVPVAQALGLDIGLGPDGRLTSAIAAGPVRVAAREKVKAVVDKWLADGWFVKVVDLDAKRMPREFVAVGAPAVSMADAIAASFAAPADAENGDEDDGRG